ncbi:MAG: hypothetical protein R6V01_06165 [Thermoplasmatota archaeon]
MGHIHVRDHISEVWHIDEGYDHPRLHWESYVDEHPPIVDAGPDQVVDEGTLVTFDGSASVDNLEIVRYECC